jgi:hypothetical protein
MSPPARSHCLRLVAVWLKIRRFNLLQTTFRRDKLWVRVVGQPHLRLIVCSLFQPVSQKSAAKLIVFPTFDLAMHHQMSYPVFSDQRAHYYFLMSTLAMDSVL